MVVPELLQKDATPEKLAQAVIELYLNIPRQAQIQEAFTQLHESLQANTDERVVSAVLREAKYLCS